MKSVSAIVAILAGSTLALAQTCSTKATACTQEGGSACASEKASACVESAGAGIVRVGYEVELDGTIVEVAEKAGTFTTLLKAAKAAGLDAALAGKGPFTVFAPTDEAFKTLPAGGLETLLRPENKDTLVRVLSYHVVPGKALAKDVVARSTWETLSGQRIDISIDGGSPKVDKANIVATDVMASNGVIHVIDRVIMPSNDNLAKVAAASGKFSTLLSAAKAAGLADALALEGPFTVFAPTDEAFAALPAGTVESLLKPENKGKLAEILKYHIVPGRVYANQAAGAQIATTLQGGTVRIGFVDGQLAVNDAKVVKTDIEAQNGVVHVINKVILP